MTIEPGQIIQRSVDGIQKIYAVVIALAISQAIQTLLKEPSGTTDLSFDRLLLGLPGFVAFLVTVVPFWQGMNRHLDRCYLEKEGDILRGALLLDLAAFFVEAVLLFAAGWLLRSGIDTFRYLGLLLGADMLWGIVSHQIHFPGKKSHVLKWSLINVVAMGVAVAVVVYPFGAKPLVLMVVAILRSVADYAFCWEFYFPNP